ncbi:MAG: RNA polymerase sigma factor [Candidatus Shapirobacteria bacterium]|jgi:RNA polymerase sigma factor (sigma-70 family)|nr:RNA polymerase sigma factor [Candidatus Shapirobacteria bacterium]
MEELVNKYQKSLAAFIRKKIGDEDVVEELTQDILMAAYRALPTFNKKSSEFSFICGIAKHKITDYYRKKKLKTVLFSVNPIIEEIAEDALTPERDVLKNELKEEIKKTMTELREDYEKILRLKYIDNWKSSQIASLMKISVKAVESRLIRARRKFQSLWNYDKEKSKEFIQARQPNRN